MADGPNRSRLGGSTALLSICLSASFFALVMLAPRELSAQVAPSPPQLIFVKVMKGSVPEYQQITVDATGSGSYQGRKLDEPPRPCALKLSAQTTQKLFELARELGDFRSIQLESHRKVANMGLKTFIYENNGHRNKVQFNYTENRRAQDLLDLFEGIGNVEEHIGTLKFSARYEPLGLPAELRQVQADLENKALVDPQLMVPILQKIAGGSQFLHIAQKRANEILLQIKDAK